MLIWMLHFTQQLGGLSKFTPGSNLHNFIFNLADAAQRMKTAETLSGSRTLSCLSHDLVTLHSLTSFISPANFDTALKMADNIFNSANDQGDDYALTQALKLYRRAARCDAREHFSVPNQTEIWLCFQAETVRRSRMVGHWQLL